MKMSKKAWFSFLLCHLFLFHGTSSATPVIEVLETEPPETTGASTINATVEQTSLPVTTTTQLPATGVIQDGKHEDPEINFSQSESLEKPLPKKRGILDALYQPGNFDENGYDANEDTGPNEVFTASKSDFEEKPFYKYGDAAFVADDGYFENEGRAKRTVNMNELYNRPQGHEVEFTPDDIIALLEYIQNRGYAQDQPNQWSYNDNTVESIEADMKDEDVYRDNRNGYKVGFEVYPQGMRGYPTERRRRNSIYEHQRSNTPSYRPLIF